MASTTATTTSAHSGLASTTTRVISIVFVAVLTAVAAQVSIPVPFTQVPFTFQPTVVLLGALVLGARGGAAAQVLYLAAGIAGLPVFATSATLAPGLLRLLGPTGGFLMAYPLAAFVTGALAQRGMDRRYATSVLAMLAGLAIIYTGGTAWLGLAARTVTGSAAIGLQAAFVSGVVPFVVADVFKIAAAAGTAPGLWRLVGRARRG
jgi:biotin transport system substrate-specific component